MRELARKGDVIALDLGEAGLAQARIEGLRVIARDKLDALAGTVTRLDILAGLAPEPAANATGGIARHPGTSVATPHIAAWLARCLAARGAVAAQCRNRVRTAPRDVGAPGRDPAMAGA